MAEEVLGKCFELAKMNSSILGNMYDLNVQGAVKLNSLSNINMLKNIGVVCSHMDIHEYGNTQFIKQRSKVWFELHSECMITGSSLYNGLGLRSVKSARDHFREFVLKEGPPKFTEEEMVSMNHGSENEVSTFTRNQSV